MRSFLLATGLMVLVLICAHGLALGAPLAGTWNAADLGTSALNGNTDEGIFKGSWLFTDPELDGTTIGDQSFARDASVLSGPGAPYYWASIGSTTVSTTRGGYEYVDGYTYRQHFETVKTGGTTYLFGDHLWGQEDGSIYKAVDMQQVSSGYTYLEWLPDRQTFGYKYTIGDSYSWGVFEGYPELMLEITSQFSLGHWGEVYPYGMSMYGAINDIEFNISNTSPVPEPATILLIGGGLLGLMGSRRIRKA